MSKTTNEILAEYMGLCWHELDEDSTHWPRCLKCPDRYSRNPAYDSESSPRSLLNGVVAKVIAEFGEEEYGYALEDQFDPNISIDVMGAMRCLQPTRHPRNLYDVAANGYDFARRVKAEMEEEI